MKKLIFVIDDERDIREILKVNLEKEGYDVATFSAAETALQELKIKKPDLPITPGIDSVRKIFDQNYDYRIKCKDSSSYINNYNLIAEEYFEKLNQLIHSIFDPNEAFCQTEDETICKYCDYKKNCHR